MRRNSPQESNAPGPGGGGSPLRVLVVDRSPEGARLILDALESAGLTPAHIAEDSPYCLAEAVARGWDVLVSGVEHAGGVRAAVRDCGDDVPVVVVRAQQGGDIATDVRRAFAEATARRERRRVAEQLQTSEIRFRAAIEGGFDAFFCFDCELDEQGATFRLAEVNTRGAALLGGTKESLVGKTFAELASDEERAAFFTEKFLRVYESGTPLEEEYEVRSPEIAARWLHFHIVPMLGGIAVSARDITEAKESSRALRESEERLLGVIQHVPGVFFTLRPSEDGEGTLRFDFVSDTIERLTGHTVAEFFGPDRITLQGLLLSEDRPLIDRVDEKILAGEPFAIDIRIVHQDGGVHWAHLKAEPTFDEAGGVCAASGVMLDITDRKEAEEALQLRERAMEAVEHGVVITDATQPGLPVVYVNPGYERLTGFSREELIGQPAANALAPSTDPAVEAEIQAAIAEGRHYVKEYSCDRKDGTTFWCSLVLSPVRDENGAVTHWFSISSDEGPRRQLEEHVLQAQKMEAVGRLAGGVAHDFNNVLLVIRGYSNVLMSILGEGSDGWEEAKEIEIAATRASELIRHLLAFSRGQVMQTRVVDLNEVISGMEMLLAPLIGEDVELRTLFEPLGPVNADPAQLEQTIVNLVVNACDAMPRGGRLTIATRNVLLDDEDAETAQLAPGMYSAIAVEDTGLGMDTETRARVFEPFFSTKDEGTGLGLSSAYGFVKQSGGDIIITSAPSEGTGVTILLPHAHDAFVEEAQTQPPRQRTLAAETVLLVEDNEKARGLVARILRESGYDVHDAGLPEDALRFCEEYEGPIHLLLSDVVMPQMSGPTLSKQILERRPETRALFVSGYIESADDVDIVSSGADFLQKPFTPTELLETVRRVLDEPDKVPA